MTLTKFFYLDYQYCVPDIETKLLRSFLAVATERSFSVAAELCGCSQGTMSIRIRQLEDQLGVRLFERKHRDVRLTFAGNQLLEDVQTFVDMHDRLFRRAGARVRQGSVRLGIDEGCAATLLPRLLEKVMRVYTALELDVLCENSESLLQKIEVAALDLAVVMAFDTVPSATQLSRPRLRWVTTPDFTIGDWDVLPIACYPVNNLLGAAARGALRSHGVPYREALCSANERAILSAVSSGTAVAVMAEGSIPDGLRVISDVQALPLLDRVRIQLLEASAQQSDAAHLVKGELAGLYPGRPTLRRSPSTSVQAANGP